MNANLLEPFKNAGHDVLVPPGRSMLREILAPTDFSDESRAGVACAVNLAEKFGAAVALLHVIEPLPVTGGMEGFPLLPTRPELIRQARIQLQRIADQESKKGSRLTTIVRTAKPFHGIITAAAEHRTDLIVMATHGYSGVNHVLLGSTAERVVRHAPCPVLTVRVPAVGSHAAAPHLRVTRILVPIDFSATSKLALPWATFLAEAFDAEIVLFHVTETYPIDYLLGRELMNQAITPLMKDAEAALQCIADNLHSSMGINASVVVRDGVPHKEICRAAQELHADVIALTTHGYTGLKHIWLGSTAERVVRNAQCPVLAVREVGKSLGRAASEAFTSQHGNTENQTLAQTPR
jgi:nucleotide-binding universal stress UspA family protein